MKATQTFEWISLGAMLVSAVLPIALLVGLPFPRHLCWRSVVVILLAWLSTVAYTILVYNAAGIASGVEQGIDSPEMKYDNNTVGIALVFGWIKPSISACAFLVARYIWQKLRLGGGVAKNSTL